MLSPTVVPRSRVARRPLLRPGLALRVVLMVAAVTYVLGPTVAQWVSFDQIRYEVAAERAAVTPTTALDADGVSPHVQDLLEDTAPDQVRDLVGPGLAAAAEIEDGAARLGSLMLDAGMRTMQVVAVVVVLVVLSVRFSKPYRPRHAGGTAAAVFSRKG